MTKKDECLKALQCLYLEVDATIADDVKRKVLDALDEANKISSNPVLSDSFLADLLDELPENRPLYKDSGLWQQRSDDMEDVYYQQRANEKTEDFIKRLYEERFNYGKITKICKTQ